MAKDRNTVANRQPGVGKKKQADQKKERLVKKKKTSGESYDTRDSQSSLSPAEHSVLSVFRTYLMTPGEMLCFYGSNLQALDAPLAQLTKKGMLVAEEYHGGYSLTESGFAAMKNGE